LESVCRHVGTTILLYALTNPVGAIPIFLAMTRQVQSVKIHRIIVRASAAVVKEVERACRRDPSQILASAAWTAFLLRVSFRDRASGASAGEGFQRPTLLSRAASAGNWRTISRRSFAYSSTTRRISSARAVQCLGPLATLHVPRVRSWKPANVEISQNRGGHQVFTLLRGAERLEYRRK
jgi:MarC family integral membrane protein